MTIAAELTPGKDARAAAAPSPVVLVALVFAGLAAAAFTLLLALTSDHLREPASTARSWCGPHSGNQTRPHRDHTTDASGGAYDSNNPHG